MRAFKGQELGRIVRNWAKNKEAHRIASSLTFQTINIREIGAHSALDSNGTYLAPQEEQCPVLEANKFFLGQKSALPDHGSVCVS